MACINEMELESCWAFVRLPSLAGRDLLADLWEIPSKECAIERASKEMDKERGSSVISLS